jgi:hypothetical protein
MTVRLDLDRDLRVDEEVLLQTRRHILLDRADRQPRSPDAADQREIERAVRVDGDCFRQRRLLEHRHRQAVLRADDVFGSRAGGCCNRLYGSLEKDDERGQQGHGQSP